MSSPRPASQPTVGTDPSVARQVNSGVVLRALRERGPLTLAELSRQVGLSRKTLDEVLPELAARRLVADLVPVAGGRAGRPARRVRFRSEAGYVISVGMTNDAVAQVADLSGTVVGSHRLPIGQYEATGRPFGLVEELVEGALAAAEVPARLLRAAGIGMPGVISKDGAIIRCDPAPGWQGADLGHQVRRWLGCPVVVCNHAASAAVGERWKGAGRDELDMLFIAAGTGVGVGVLIGGELFRGSHGAAAQLGEQEGPIPAVGLRWGRSAKALSWLRRLFPDGPEEDALHRCLHAAATGEKEPAKFAAEYVESLAQGIGELAVAFDPALLILGGALSDVSDALLAPVQRELERVCFFPALIKRSVLAEDASVIGGIRMALDLAELSLFAG